MLAIAFRRPSRPSTLLPALTLMVAAGPAASQSAETGSVEGRVTDAATGSPIAAVTVRVLGTDRSAFTGDEGRFRITRLAPGTRSFAFETLGYRSRVVEAALEAGRTATLDVALTSAPLALEGVVVTSQKRQQAIQEVPITVTVHDGDFLESVGIGQFDILSSYTPGLEVQLQSPNNPGFVVRGITSDDGDARVESRVSVFQDGVSISKARGSVVELFDLERVEVLKGPQGTLFGRGAEIGAVHLIQNKARNERSAELTVGPGSHGHGFVEGVANSPLVEDRLFARLAGVYNVRDGYVDNLAGGVLNGKETLALRGLLRWAPDEFTDVDLIVNWQQDRPPGTAFKSGVFAPSPGGSTEPWAPAHLGGDPRFEDLFVDRTVWGATLLGDRVLSPAWTLQGIAAYRRFDSYESFDADGTAAPAVQLAEGAYGDQYSVELRALFNDGGRFSGFVGTNLFHEDAAQAIHFRTDERSLYPFLTRVIDVQTGGAFPEIPVVVDGQPNFVDSVPENVVDLAPLLWPEDSVFYRIVLEGLVGTPLPTYHEESFTNYGRNTAYELFADGTLELTDRLALTAGVRATLETLWSGIQVRESEQASFLGAVTGATPNVLFSPTQNQELVNHEETFFSVVGRLAANYAVNEALNAYATVARGRRPPVIQEFETNPIANFEILPDEVVWSYEIGAKGFVGPRVQYDIAAFYYDYQDFQTDVNPELTPSGIVFDTDVGQATAYGAELGLVGRVSDALTFFGNYAYIHARFDETSPTGEEQRLAGNTFRLTPEHSASAGFGLRTAAPFGEWFLRPSCTWKSRVYFEEEWQEETFLDGEAPGLYQDPYGLVNLRAGLTAFDGRATVELWGTNLLDADYIIDAGNTGIAFYAPTYIAGPPALFGLRVTARF